MLLVGNGSSPLVWVEMVYPGSEIRLPLACFPVLIYGLDGGQTMFFLKLLGKFCNFAFSEKIITIIALKLKYIYQCLESIL